MRNGRFVLLQTYLSNFEGRREITRVRGEYLGPKARRGSAVGIETMLRAGRPGTRIPVQAENFSLLQKRPYLLWGPPSILLTGTGVSYPK
jgi:hypothetical protein